MIFYRYQDAASGKTIDALLWSGDNISDVAAHFGGEPIVDIDHRLLVRSSTTTTAVEPGTWLIKTTGLAEIQVMSDAEFAAGLPTTDAD